MFPREIVGTPLRMGVDAVLLASVDAVLLASVDAVLLAGVDLAALRVPLGALAGVTALMALVAFAYGRYVRARGSEAALDRLDRGLTVALPVAYLAALGAMVAGGWFEVLNDAVEASPPDRGGIRVTVATIGALAVPGVAAAGTYLGGMPARTALSDATVTSELRRLAAVVAGIAASFTVLVVALLAANPDTSTGLGQLGSTVVVVAVVLAGSPWLGRLFNPTRSPTAGERERIERLCESGGCSPHLVWVVEGDATAATFRGVPGRRHLFLGEALLAVDDDHLRTYLATRASRARLLHRELRAVVVLGALALAAALAGGAVPAPVGGPVAAGIVLVTGVVVLWVGQRLVYVADADAADRASTEAVVSAVRAVADRTDAPTEWGPLTALRRMEPSPARRLARLQERDDG